MHNKRRNNMNGGGGNGGQHRHHNNNRPRRFNNNRPQGEGGGNDPANVARTRRNATQNREKYLMNAQAALSSGDRVLAEYYFQHADHYHRVILALPPEEAPRPQYLRGHNPNEQPGSENPSDANGNQPQGSQDEHQQHNQPQHHQAQHHQPQSGAAHGLPSFITQPANPDGAGE